MNLALYQAIQNELNLRAKGEKGEQFNNLTTEQLNQLKSEYEQEISKYLFNKIMNHMMKGCAV